MLGVSSAAFAGDAPTPEAKKRAAQEFVEGQKAFKTGDYRHAAESFEAAYRDAPHPASLWNAARAWHRADEKTRAANLYAKYLRDAPPNARDRNSATEGLKQLAAQLARLEIHAPDMTDVRVDDQPIEDLTIYVTPGAHVISAKAGDKPVRQPETVQAGAVVSVALVPPKEEPPPPPPPPPPKPRGLSPWFFYAGAGATALGVGLTMWSGLDTVSAKKSFDAHPSQEGLDAGKSKQGRTNVLLGVTIGFAAVTGVVGLVLVDWGKPTSDTPPQGADAPKAARIAKPRGEARITPTGITVSGEF